MGIKPPATGNAEDEYIYKCFENIDEAVDKLNYDNDAKESLKLMLIHAFVIREFQEKDEVVEYVCEILCKMF